MPRVFAVSMTVDPVPGLTGDPRVLEALKSRGMTVEPVNGTTKARIGLAAVPAESSDAAARQAQQMVRSLVPENGYVVSEPKAVENVPPQPSR